MLLADQFEDLTSSSGNPWAVQIWGKVGEGIVFKFLIQVQDLIVRFL